MNIPNVLFLLIGLACIYVGIKQFLFFLKGGGLTWDMRIYSQWPSLAKSNATQEERTQLILQACILFFLGLVFCYEAFSLLGLLH